MQHIIPGAEPFFFKGNDIGCLLVHGFTGSPKEMREMGEYLADQGYSVLGIRLAGHATVPADLPRTKWVDWLTSLEDGLHLLKGISRHIFVIGLSMGGILTLLASAHYEISGAVALSTPYALPDDWRLKFIGLVSRIQPEIPKGPPDWQNPDAAKDHIEYPRYPTRSIGELYDLLKTMRDKLPAIRIPVLLVHSRADTTVPPENMTRIAEKIGSADKTMLWLEKSGHVITREPERQLVFQAVTSFIQRVAQP